MALQRRGDDETVSWICVKICQSIGANTNLSVHGYFNQPLAQLLPPPNAHIIRVDDAPFCL